MVVSTTENVQIHLTDDYTTGNAQCTKILIIANEILPSYIVSVLRHSIMIHSCLTPLDSTHTYKLHLKFYVMSIYKTKGNYTIASITIQMHIKRKQLHITK